MHALEDVSTCFATSCNGQSGDFLTTAAIHITNSQYVNFDFVNITRTGGYGIWFDILSFYDQVTNSELTDLGAGGVRVGRGISGIVPENQLVQHILINNSYII